MPSWGRRQYTLLKSCELLCMLILAEVRVIFPWVAYGWSMHIVREEHWAANESHAHMVEVSAGLKPQKSLWDPLIVAKEEVHVCCLCFPGMDVPVEIFPNWEIMSELSPRTFVQEARRYPFVTLGWNICMWWKSMETRANYDKVWALLAYYAWGKQAYRKFYYISLFILKESEVWKIQIWKWGDSGQR